MKRPATKVMWITAEGQMIDRHMLGTDHLRNILNMIEARRLSKTWVRLPTFAELKKLGRERGLRSVEGKQWA